MADVSLIIPVYGARDTIAACLDSVIAQTLDSIEVVLVDDHGPDDSLALARAHLAAYAGPKVFRFTETLANAGPGTARNKGLETATGEYVAFLDSDDRLEPDFCARLYASASAARADLACCDALRHEGDRTRRLCNPVFPDGALDERTRRRVLRELVTYLWTYLFRRAFLLENQIRFPASRSAEDTCLVCCCWLSAGRVARVQAPLYHYEVAPQSLSGRRDPDRWRQRLASLRSFERYARSSGRYRGRRCLVRRLVIRKGWLLAARDYLSNNLFK